LVGIVVYFVTIGVITPPTVSIPKLNGVVSIRTIFVSVSPQRIPP
jgi:hypothetical protein